MAVRFNQNSSGLGHTCIWKDGVSLSLPFTFDCWVNVDGFEATRVLITLQRPGGGDDFALQLNGGDAFSVDANISDFVWNETSITSADGVFGAWVHVAAVFEGATNVCTSMTAYLNGVPATPNTNDLNLSPDSCTRLVIGGDDPSESNSFGLRGCMARATVRNVALDDAEVLSLANGAAPDTVQGGARVAYLPLVDEATALVDEIGAGWSLTEIGAGISTCADSPDEPAPVETGEADECGAEDEADAIAPCDVEWPTCDLVPTRIQVDLFSPSVSPGRSFSGLEQLVQPDAGHWRIVYGDVAIRTRAHALRWREIESALNGRNGTVCVPVYAARLSSTPIAATAAGDYEIGIARIGIAQTAGATIRAGMHFSAGERLHIVTVLHSTESGVHDVSITPPLREASEEDDTLDFNDPHCRCRLERDDSMNVSMELLRFSRPSVTFVEDV